MAETQSVPMASQPREIPGRAVPLQIPPPSSVALPPPSSASKLRNSHLQLDTFSPVNQNGSFEFDRVLKSGFVEKRTRKTKVDILNTGRMLQSLIKCTGLETYLSGSATQLSLDVQRRE
jgi:hypothetical protein